MTKKKDTIIIKRYASRRLYNTLTSDYITLEEVAQYIRDGKDIKIVDRKTGDDLTRQYLMQIITDYESRGENVLPINVLTDIVRSYNNQAQNFIPDFLSQSYEMLKNQQTQMINSFQSKVAENIPPMPSIKTMPQMEGLEQWQKMQSEFLGKMMNAWNPESPDNHAEEESADEPSQPEAESKPKAAPKKPAAKTTRSKSTTVKTQKPTPKKKSVKAPAKPNENQADASDTSEEEINLIKKQLSELQARLHNL